ncbi:ThiF family adenylyltransferase [Exiguobacterium sp. A1_3_1]|uniref:ThiF family adenylyltransferase n=1 Tax=Exiguobacterium sp. A1_3_1 TaxID=2651871 RepID=UPI003B89645D
MSIVQFKPYVKVFLNEEIKKATLSRVWEDNFEGIVYDMNDLGIFILKKIESLCEEIVLRQEISENFPNDIEEADEIINFLKTENYIEIISSDYYKPDYLEKDFGRIIPLLSIFETDSINRYKIQENIMNKKIGVIGSGTMGFSVISKLVSNGIKNFVLIDNDIVEKSNLTRQPLFSLKHINKLKVEVVKQHIEDRIEDSDVLAINKYVTKIEDLSILKDVDLIINCADDIKTSLIEKYIFENNIPTFFGGGYIGHVGRIDPLVIPGFTKCFSCNEKKLKDEFDDIGTPLKNHYKESTISSMSDFISSVLSFEVLKFLANPEKSLLLDKFLFVNFSDYSIKEIKPNNHFPTDCSICNSNSLIV